MLSSLPQLLTHDAYTLWYTTPSNPASHFDSSQFQSSHGSSLPTDHPHHHHHHHHHHPPPPFPHQHQQQQHVHRRPTLGNITNTPSSSQRSTAEVLFSLRQSEAFIAQRKLNIQRFGASWIRPPGVAKTYQASMDEAIEREEQERLLERVGEMEIVEVVGAEVAGQGLGLGLEAGGQMVGGVQEEEEEEEDERDLDEEIPDADGLGDLDELDELDEDEEELEERDERREEEEEEDDEDDGYETEDDDGLMIDEEDGGDLHAEAAGRDLDEEIPEGGSYEHTDTDISIDDDEEEEDEESGAHGQDVAPTLVMASSSSSAIRGGITTQSGSIRRTLQTAADAGGSPGRRRSRRSGVTVDFDARVTGRTGSGAGAGFGGDGRDSTAHLVGAVMEEDSSGMTSMMEDSLLGRGRGGRRRGG
ncbi:MAG: hypothetical protein M1816_002521 [Peltula sp. TS41687]|nr:MAG: hypothetical protein M1816_002521 [Peltula sp. TS41687]